MELTNKTYSALVVDDTPAKLYAVSRILRHNNFEVDSATTGAEAIVKSKNFPDVIILDVMLPDIDGFKVCNIIKSDPLTANIPVIHLSAKRLESKDQIYGMEMGADIYLIDPVDPNVLIATINSMIRIRVAERQTNLIANQWQTTFDSIDEGIILLNLKMEVVSFNKAILKILKKEEEALNNKKLYELNNSFSHFTPDYILNKVTPSEEILISGCWYEAKFTSISDAFLVKEGYVFILNDITELKNTLIDLERSNDDLEQFAYIVSHDLREPLRMISRYSQLVVKKFKERIGSEADDFLKIISEGTFRMQKMITDLLKYSQITTNPLSFSYADCNVILKLAKDDLKFIIEDKDATINSSPLPTVYASQSALLQLFENIISNALKFNVNKPVININCKLENDHWLFSFADNGIGINSVYNKRIFEVFQRLHTKEQYAGTGIGLAISKKIVEFHKGEIWVESELGKGATFYFTIPLKQDA
jgi:signal transduction histidine kinase